MMFSVPSQLLPANYPSPLAQQYDSEAPTWDRKLQYLGFNRVYEQLFRDLKNRGGLSYLRHDAQVLDMGIGTGALTAALLKSTALNLRITGVDISPEMLHVAEKRLSQLGARYTLLQTDIGALSSMTHNYNLIICAHVLEHLANPAACVTQVRQMLTPGGRFMLVITRCGPWGYYLRHRWHITPATPFIVREWFEQAGLTEVAFVPLQGMPWSQFKSIAVTGVAA